VREVIDCRPTFAGKELCGLNGGYNAVLYSKNYILAHICAAAVDHASRYYESGTVHEYFPDVCGRAFDEVYRIGIGSCIKASYHINGLLLTEYITHKIYKIGKPQLIAMMRLTHRNPGRKD
jgi:hypothetical protein